VSAPSALRDREFRIWLTALFITNVGAWMQRLAQEWYVLKLSGGSGTALGVVTGLQFLPALLIGPIAGVVADRYPRKRIMLLVQTVVGVAGAALGVDALSGDQSLVPVYVLAVLTGIAGAVFQPAMQAFLVDLAGARGVSATVGLTSGAFQAGRLVGPGVAGALIGLGGTGLAFLVAAAATVLPVLAAFRTGTVEQPRLVPTTTGYRMLLVGIRYSLSHPDIALTLGVMVFVGTFAANIQMTNALMATSVFGVGADRFGLLSSVLAAGAIAGAILGGRRRNPTARYVVCTAACFCLLDMLSALLPSYGWFIAAVAVVGLSQLVFITASSSLQQLSSGSDMRGRIAALNLTVLTGTTPIGAPAIGWTAQQIGPQQALLVFGGIALVGTLSVGAVSALRRRKKARELAHAG
jgi:MFS family permease